MVGQYFFIVSCSRAERSDECSSRNAVEARRTTSTPLSEIVACFPRFVYVRAENSPHSAQRELIQYPHPCLVLDHTHDCRVIQLAHPRVDHLLEELRVFNGARNGDIVFAGGIQNDIQILQLHVSLEARVTVTIE